MPTTMGLSHGEWICPSRPVFPTPPTYTLDVAMLRVNHLRHLRLRWKAIGLIVYDYETWPHEEKCAKPILLANMESDLSLSLRGFATSHIMWDHLHHTYEIHNQTMYLSVVEEA